MLVIEILWAVFLLVCLICFFIVNLCNILVVRRSLAKAYAEIERPSGFAVGLAAFGTGIYFLEVLLYQALAFSGFAFLVQSFSFSFPYLFALFMQALGAISTFTGYFLFIWSVIARNKYAVSWEMPENHKLVTWGPYRYVRHPSYLGYFLMFFGLFIMWTNIFTFFPILAIPGYFRVSFAEEQLLLDRFGETYMQYQKTTGRFIPKFKRHQKEKATF